MADEKIISIKIQTDAETKDIAALQTRLVKLTKQRNDLNKKIRDGVTLTAKEKQALGQLQPELVATRNKLRDMERQVVKNNNALKKNSGFVAGVKKGMKGALSSMALYAGGFLALGRVISNIAGVIRDFDKSQGQLRAVTGKTKDELKSLTNQAKELGSTTAFTATQATEAQIELAKLGFTVRQITELTPSVLSLAAATGTDLANAASIAGSTVRAFGLDASETERVVDVMANSFTKSSLDIEKFKTAMGNVAPVAASAGVSIEETTALIGTLTDSGIDASTAGTGLRNVFLELTKSGMTFEEAMKEIQNSTNKNATALELFGKRGATIGTVLAGNTEKTKELTEALNDSAGAAEKMANEQLNTLSGKLTILGSAWEGFILGLEDGEGALSSAFKVLVVGLTDILTGLGRINLSLEDIQRKAREASLSDALKEVSKEARELGEKLGDDKRALELLIEQFEKLDGQQNAETVKFLREELARLEKTTVDNYNATINETDAIDKNTKAKNKNAKSTEKQTAAFKLQYLEREKASIKFSKDKLDIELMEVEDTELVIDKQTQLDIDANKAELERTKNLQAAKQAAVQAGLDGINDAIGVAFDAQTRKAERAANAEIAILDNKLDKAEISEEDYRKEVDKIREAQFEKEKKQAIIENTLNSAVAFMKSAAEYGFTPALGVAGAGLGAALIAQNAIVSAQQYEPVEFAEGGLLQGASHANGGIPMTVNGQSGFEAEGGEAIINKKSTAMFLPLLSQINEAGGGVSFTKPLGARKFAVGGLTPNVAPIAGNSDLINAINSRIDRMQVVNVASDTAAVAGRVQNIESDASFG